MSDYWDEYNRVASREGGSGGIVCKALIEFGYKVYVSGPTQEESWFAAPGRDTPDANKVRKRQLAAAKKLAAQYNAAKGPQWGIQIRAYRDTAVVRGQPATWQGDRFFNCDKWVSAYKEVLVPSLRESGVGVLPWEGWCRIGFKDNPYHVKLGKAGMTDRDQDDNPRFPQVAYIVEIFADETAARAAVGAIESQPSPVEAAFPEQADVPEGWSAKEWERLIPVLRAAVRDEGQTAEVVADDYGVAVKYVKAALKD